jgi:formylglycine-generating enzyme required for sulfatase activity
MYEDDDGFPATAPVGSFPDGQSVYGLHDVAGNVWEWVADWYAPYPSEVVEAPAGPAAGEARVVRGGGWNGSHAAWVRPTFRFHQGPDERSHGVGFRCAR